MKPGRRRNYEREQVNMRIINMNAKKLAIVGSLGLALVVGRSANAGTGGSASAIQQAIASNSVDSIKAELERAEFLVCAACVDLVTPLVDHPDYRVREVAGWWLARRAIARQVQVAMLNRLSQPDSTAALNAADVLGAFHFVSSIPALGAALSNPLFSGEARAEMAKALGTIGRPAGTQYLTTALADSDPQVRSASLLALRTSRASTTAASRRRSSATPTRACAPRRWSPSGCSSTRWCASPGGGALRSVADGAQESGLGAGRDWGLCLRRRRGPAERRRQRSEPARPLAGQGRADQAHPVTPLLRRWSALTTRSGVDTIGVPGMRSSHRAGSVTGSQSRLRRCSSAADRRRRPKQHFYDVHIQPILNGSCIGNTSPCTASRRPGHRGTALGNLDLTSFDRVQKRRDVLRKYGSYP